MTNSPNPYRLGNDVVPSAYRIFLTPDLDKATFSGRVEIDVDIRVSSTTLTLNGIDLDVGAATVTVNAATHQSESVTKDDTYETVTFHFSSALPSGEATIEIAFTGILNDQLHGFYRSTFTDDAGTVHTIATTQFESNDARRAFPCFDEPALKATFQVTLTVPSQLAAFSNSVVLADTDLGNGLRTVEFAPTMKMSTYLVAFVVGPFEATEPIDVDGINLRAIYPVGKGHLTSWCLEVAEHALRFFSEYFDIAYPGDKYDLIAIPDFAAGAMENLGLVTFREAEMLIDPERASQDQLERVALVVNHETAHMWFGDLVTMEWWEGIWLNEAFATFMEMLCTDHFRPQWKKWASFNPSRDQAFATDGLHSTRPIEYEVMSPADCRGMFDVLTYIKGSSVLRMLEQYLGAETFRDGIRLYLVKHSYANARTIDLWAALEEASGQPVGAIMDTWILQGGFPLIAVENGRVSQSPFQYTEPTGASNIGQNWKVPILSRPLDSSAVTRQLLSAPSDALALAGPVVVNAGGTGFYRVAYGSSELASISAHLKDLDDVERASLFSDTWAATLVGRSSIGDLLALAKGMGDLDEPAVWTVVAQAIRSADRLVDDDGRAVLRTLTSQLLTPQLARLGWVARDGESEQAGTLRAIVIELLGVIAKDADVVTEALRRFDANDMTGDLLAPVLRITANQDRDGAESVFDQRRLLAPTPQEEQAYLFAPATSPNLAQVTRLFERCFNDIRNQDAPYVIGQMIANSVVGADIWHAFSARFDEAVAKFPMGTCAATISAVATLMKDPTLASEIRAFHTAHPLPAAQRQVEQALERMDINVAFGQRVKVVLNQQLQSAVQ